MWYNKTFDTSVECDGDSINSEDDFMSVKSHLSDALIIGDIDTIADDIDGNTHSARLEKRNTTAVEQNDYSSSKFNFLGPWQLHFET